MKKQVLAKVAKPLTILEEAQLAVYGDRQADYGNVLDNFGTTAKLWEIVLGAKVTPEQVGLCMIQLKIARQMFKPKRDNLVDAAGYAATIEKMNDERKKIAENNMLDLIKMIDSVKTKKKK